MRLNMFYSFVGNNHFIRQYFPKFTSKSLKIYFSQAYYFCHINNLSMDLSKATYHDPILRRFVTVEAP